MLVDQYFSMFGGFGSRRLIRGSFPKPSLLASFSTIDMISLNPFLVFDEFRTGRGLMASTELY